MSNTIKPMDNTMLTKISDKVGSAKDSMSSTGALRVDSGQGGPKGTPGSDTVELTSSAKLLERLEKTLASMPEIDTAKVAAVKDAIANGDYEIDAGKIADALIRSDRELGS